MAAPNNTKGFEADKLRSPFAIDPRAVHAVRGLGAKNLIF
jgi:hypothetical protein